MRQNAVDAPDSKVPAAVRSTDFDTAMMQRCIALSAGMPRIGDLPIACVISDGKRVVAEATNQVFREGDVTRHAEIIAISLAQKVLKRRNLSDCILYSTIEPCPMCSFPIRESRIKRVVYALNSPMMGGVSKWNILRDPSISDAIPEVFGPVPDVIAGLLSRDAARVWWRWNPLIWAFIKRRGFFGQPPATDDGSLMPAIRQGAGWLRSLIATWR